MEEIESGAKVRELREVPAAQILFDAYWWIVSSSVFAEPLREKLHSEQLWVREAVEGRWFGVAREAAQAFIMTVASRVSGNVEYWVTPHLLTLRSLKAAKPLYIRNRDNI